MRRSKKQFISAGPAEARSVLLFHRQAQMFPPEELP